MLADTGGLILAGGRSRRFGAEKSVALFRGRTLLDRAVDALSPCAAIAVSAREGSGAAGRARTLGLNVLYDDPSSPAGPLAGIAAGLAWAQAHGFVHLATAPCDAPLAGAEIVERLGNARNGTAPIYAETPLGAEPLFALWPAALLAPLSAALQAGAHPPIHVFLDAHGATRARFPDARAFTNANTPDDLAALE